MDTMQAVMKTRMQATSVIASSKDMLEKLGTAENIVDKGDPKKVADITLAALDMCIALGEAVVLLALSKEQHIMLELEDRFGS